MNSNVFKERLDYLHEKQLYREPIHYAPKTATIVERDGKEYMMMASNNYLGLTHHPKIIDAAKQAIDMYGTGSGGSRLTSGSHMLFKELEASLAAFEGTENALVFNTGYMTNLGVISALIGKDDYILSDELNHASIIDGCRLSKGKTLIYPHKDIATAEKLLKDLPTSSLKLIVTDSVFSMDGDIAPIDDLYALAKKYGALLMVDDAHATGVLAEGHGSAAYFNLQGKIDLQVGTLSKALASEGGFVATNQLLHEYLVNKARGFIFSTALTPADIGAAKAALEVIQEEPCINKRLCANVTMMHQELAKYDIHIESETPILPIVVGENNIALNIANELKNNGIILSAIRPPTVPIGQARLRLTVTAAHTAQNIIYVAEKIGKAYKKYIK